jgi:hypothetical protein
LRGKGAEVRLSRRRTAQYIAVRARLQGEAGARRAGVRARANILDAQHGVSPSLSLLRAHLRSTSPPPDVCPAVASRPQGAAAPSSMLEKLEEGELKKGKK